MTFIRTQIQLTEEQMNKLKALASAQRVSVAELIRQSVDQMLRSPELIDMDERRRRAMAAAGRFSSGDKEANISSEHDRYLDEAYSSWLPS